MADAHALDRELRGLKHLACPRCRKIGVLNRHSRIDGNDPHAHQGRLPKGQRVFCSNRGRRGGCGRTFPILLAWALPRHTFTAPLLWKAVAGWLDGTSIKASWEAAQVALGLDSFYHLLQRLRRRLTVLRTALCPLGRPPASRWSDPLRQSFEHLRAVFAAHPCAPEAFQLRLQQAFAG